MIKKLAILTSGGDAPGMNNAIIAVAKTAIMHGITPYVVTEGYKGLAADQIQPVAIETINQYIATSGTFIYSARYPEFKKASIRKQAKANLDRRNIDALIVIGGDGSYKGAELLHELGVKTIALPGTIDNDITSTDVTIGYNTALNTIVENVSRIRDTMESHQRTAIVEVMGHGCGDLALYSGLATGAEIIVTNDNVMTPEAIAKTAKKLATKGRRSTIIIVSEFIYKDLDHLAAIVEKTSGRVTRWIRLAHIQRGGTPVVQERIAAMRMGMYATELLVEGKSGLAVGIVNDQVEATPIRQALAKKRTNKKQLAIKFNRFNQV